MAEAMVFPGDFLWGAATASFQVEGATAEGGRGASIWDTFCRVPGAVLGGDNGDVACDHYHRFAEDVALMAKLGIRAYRFSIAWPRIFPSGSGTVNEAGLDFYRRLIGALLDAGIEPVATLYHWDLPQALQDAGGWAERATAEAFAAYAGTCFSAFGGSVRRWITLNEPWCSAYLGYLYGEHAPGIRDAKAAYRAVHHLNLAHGLALREFRNSGQDGQIGIVWNLSTPRPATRSPEDIAAVEQRVDRNSRMFTGPVFGKGYPEDFLRRNRIELPLRDGDLELIAAPIDFVGLNYYFEHAVSADPSGPEGVEAPWWQESTAMGWPIVPEGLRRQLEWIRDESGGIPLYVTENGMAREDTVTLDAGPTGTMKRVHDGARVDYLRSHLAVCSEAIADGIPLKGYFLWSLMDNFEWAYGYSKRFGAIYCDYGTLERIPKDSFYFYRDVIAGYPG